MLAVIAGAAGRATAADSEGLDEITNLNKQALEAYDSLDFARARKLLKQALDLCSSSGLDRHPIKARTHIHMGVVLIVGFKQRDVGKIQFEKALEIQPSIQLTKSLANPDVRAVFDEVAGAGAASGSATAPATRTTAPADQAADDEDDNEDDRATAVAQARAQAAAKRKPKRCADDEEDCQSGESDDAAAGDRGRGRGFFIAVLGGSGFGYAMGQGELNPDNRVKSPGLAPSAAGQIAPEIGYFISPSLRISVQLRLQMVSGATPVNLDRLAVVKPGTDVEKCGSDHLCSPTNNAIGGFVRASWFFGSGAFQPYVLGAIGGGQIRHSVTFSSPVTVCGAKGDQTCVDTVLSGPVFIGPGVGALFALGDMFGLVAEANTYAGFPKFTFHIDVNGGVALRF